MTKKKKRTISDENSMLLDAKKFQELIRHLHCIKEDDLIKIFGKELGEHYARKFLGDQTWSVSSLICYLDNNAMKILFKYFREYLASQEEWKKDKKTIKLRGADFEFEIIDSTHIKLRLVGTEIWGVPLHFAQMQAEGVKQLNDLGLVTGYLDGLIMKEGK